MDIRYFYQEILLVLFFLDFHAGFYVEDDYEDGVSFGRCPWIRNKLKNGRVRYRYKGRVAKFLCDSGYDLAGKRSSTCVRGQWSNPVPVCVARGCPRTPMIANGHVTEMHRGALLVYDCNPGYTLEGAAQIHCDGRRWSTGPPTCVVSTENPDTFCDFESPDLCGWSHDPNHDFDWRRNQFATPSGHAGTGPSFDHTFGENKGGYYLYIEASSPRKINDTARLFSPVYPSGMSGGCFLFWYHMYGATTGGLRVYLKPESHVFDELLPKWEMFGDQGNKWNRGSVEIPVLNENFQIVIEGIRGESYVGDSAIDDVLITTQECNSVGNDTGVAESTNVYSCRGRCGDSKDDTLTSSCSCSNHCAHFPTASCCNDYVTFCFEGTDTTIHSSDEGPSEQSVSKSSSATSTTEKISVVSTSTILPETTTQFSNETSAGISSSTILQTLPITHSSLSSTISSTSARMSSLPISISPKGTTIISTEVLDESSPSLTSTSSPKTTIHSTTSVSPSTRLNAAVRTTTTTANPTTTPTAATSTTTSTTTPIPKTTTSTTTSTTPTPKTTTSTTTSTTTPIPKTTTSTTTSTTTPIPKTATSSTTMKTTKTSTNTKTTLPSTLSTTTSTSLLPSSIVTITSSKGTTISSTVSTTVQSTTTTTSSIPTTSSGTTEQTTKAPYNLRPRSTSSTSPVPTTVTTESTTRKIYNLRPRTQSTTPVPSTTQLTDSTERLTDTTAFPRTSVTSSKNDISTPDVIKITIPLATSWHRYPFTTSSQTTRTMFRQPTTPRPPPKPTNRPSTSSQYVKQTTNGYTPQIFRLTSTETQSLYDTTADSYEMGASKTETTSSSSSMPIVISAIAVIVCIAGAVAYYYRRKQNNKRQSKLSDDSEMRFLQENEYMEYSDASALDRILVK